MPASISNIVLQPSLNYIKNNTTKLCICSAQPLTYMEAISVYKLAIKDVGPSNLTVNGNKVTMSAFNDVLADAEGIATYIAWVDSMNLDLLNVFICVEQPIILGRVVETSAHSCVLVKSII
jgi:hypothetical protein